MDSIYKIAVEKMNSSITEEQFTALVKYFEKLGDFKNSKELAQECLQKAEEAHKHHVYEMAKLEISNKAGNYIDNLENAIKQFSSIIDYKDSAEQIEICKQKIEDLKLKEEKERLEKERQREIAKAEYLKKQNKIKKIIAIACAIIAIFIVVAIVTTQVIIPSNKYSKANALYESGNYQEAYSLFIELGDYKESYQYSEKIYNDMLSECQITNYCQTLSAGSNHTVGLKSDGTVVGTGTNLNYKGVSKWTNIKTSNNNK